MPEEELSNLPRKGVEKKVDVSHMLYIPRKSQVRNMSRHIFYIFNILCRIVCLNFEHGVSGAKVGAFMNHSRKRRRGVDII